MRERLENLCQGKKPVDGKITVSLFQENPADLQVEAFHRIDVLAVGRQHRRTRDRGQAHVPVHADAEGERTALAGKPDEIRQHVLSTHVQSTRELANRASTRKGEPCAEVVARLCLVSFNREHLHIAVGPAVETRGKKCHIERVRTGVPQALRRAHP